MEDHIKAPVKLSDEERRCFVDWIGKMNDEEMREVLEAISVPAK